MARMHLGHHLAPPRFIAFVAIFIAGLFLAIPAQGWGRGAMIAFDVAAIIFLAMIMPLFRQGGADQMRAAAQRNDANRAFLLLLTVVTSTVILVAVVTEKLEKATPFTIALVLVSLVLAWTFSNTIYALHYAHLYYLPAEDGEDSRGIDYPNCDDPDYWDFVYFSFTLGMTFQTSDVEISSRRVRRIVTGHCLAAFVFNLGVLAFTINSIGGG
ncbi:MAG: DUF1345 domain-containing protein [Sphingomonas sp.]|uniref:DUF1345 domain-containing protein n=1 Tax=Sphingomonas sp. TaxID=28214 RepID=UPI003F7FEFA1